MLPAKAILYKCPHCGNKKPLVNLISGNTFGGHQWSDTKAIYPMLPKVSPIQRCPECGHFWFAHDAKTSGGEDYSMDTGELSYKEAKEALDELWDKSLREQDEINLLLGFVFSYNDAFFRGEDCGAPTQEDTELFDKVILALTELKINDTLKAELLREAERFGECIEFLHDAKPVEGFEAEVRETILKKAQEEDCRVFEL